MEENWRITIICKHVLPKSINLSESYFNIVYYITLVNDKVEIIKIISR